MKFRVEKKDKMKVVGFTKVVDTDKANQVVPEFWDEVIEKYAPHYSKGLAPEGELECDIMRNHIGEFGVCMDDIGIDGKSEYMIAGLARDDRNACNMDIREIAKGDWAIFDCQLYRLQSTFEKIVNEWIPQNPDYELAGNYNVEWYSPDDEPGPGQKCQIWIPIRKKLKAS